QRMPFNKLVELVNPVRDPARNPLISVNFNLQKAFLEDRRYGAFELISSPSQSPGVIYDLSFIMIGRPTGWRMSIEYNADLFEAGTIEGLLQLWRDAYEIALDHPEAPLSSLAAPERSAQAAAKAKPVDAAIASRPPVDTRMEALAELWKDVLQIPQIRPDDDFFALGGHSLLALRLLSEVRARFDATPTLQLLFKQPTFAGFAASIFNTEEVAASREKAVNPWELITCKHGEGTVAVYTLNHPFLYYRLAGALPDSVSVHNVNMFHADLANGLDRLSIEDIASHAIDAMQIGKAVTRVSIVGLCVNGVLAMEVSRQLREKGIDVGTTAIIDAWAPGYFASLPKSEQKQWNRERRRKRLAYFTRKLLSRRIRLIDYLKEFEASLSLLRMFGVKAGQYSAEEEANEAVTKLLVSAARLYKPLQAKDPTVMLLRSSATHPRARQLRFGWGDAVGDDCMVVDIDGWHEDSLTSNGIRDLATALSGKLAGG
ncbi:MAG: condensation protein, partial [Rhizobium sp.]